MNPIINIVVANVALLGAGAMLFYKSWLDYLRPDWFHIFRVYENGMLNYREHKYFLPIQGGKESRDIAGTNYDKTGVRPYIDPKGVYTWNFEQGKNLPIVFNNNTENIDGKLVMTVKKNLNQAIDDAVAPLSNMEDLLRTWGMIILAVAVLAMIGYMVTKDQKTTEILLNISRR